MYTRIILLHKEVSFCIVFLLLGAHATSRSEHKEHKIHIIWCRSFFRNACYFHTMEMNTQAIIAIKNNKTRTRCTLLLAHPNSGSHMATVERLQDAGSLFIKRTDVLPQDLVKSQSREIGWYNYRIALIFDMPLGNVTAEAPVKLYIGKV